MDQSGIISEHKSDNALADLMPEFLEHLPAGPVPAAQSAPGAEEGRHRVAASILTAVYHMLRDGTFYNDLGPQHFARHDKTRAAMRLVRRIKDLGYDVEIKAAA